MYDEMIYLASTSHKGKNIEFCITPYPKQNCYCIAVFEIKSQYFKESVRNITKERIQDLIHGFVISERYLSYGCCEKIFGSNPCLRIWRKYKDYKTGDLTLGLFDTVEQAKKFFDEVIVPELVIQKLKSP